MTHVAVPLGRVGANLRVGPGPSPLIQHEILVDDQDLGRRHTADLLQRV